VPSALQVLPWMLLGLIVATFAVRPIARRVLPADRLPAFGEMLGEIGFWLFMSGIRMIFLLGGAVVVFLLVGFVLPKSINAGIDELVQLTVDRVGAVAVPAALAAIVWAVGFVADMRNYFRRLRAGPPRLVRRPAPEPEYRIVHTIDPHTGRVTRQLEGRRTRTRMTVMPAPPSTLRDDSEEPARGASGARSTDVGPATNPQRREVVT